MQKIWVVLSLLMSISTAVAAEKSTMSVEEMKTSRSVNRIGAYFGVLDPLPTLVSLNVGYNATDFLRVVAGAGKVSFGTASVFTLGGGPRVMVPGWSLSPVAGISAAYVSVSGDAGDNGFSASTVHIYGTLGLDWQTSGGFNMGVGYNVAFRSGVGGLPYLHLGHYFDFI